MHDLRRKHLDVRAIIIAEVVLQLAPELAPLPSRPRDQTEESVNTLHRPVRITQDPANDLIDLVLADAATGDDVVHPIPVHGIGQSHDVA